MELPPPSRVSQRSQSATVPSRYVGPPRHVISAPRYGQGRVTPDLNKKFVSCEQQSVYTTMYLDAGRTVQLNINRLPTPSMHKDFRTSILLGGFASYSAMAEHMQRTPSQSNASDKRRSTESDVAHGVDDGTARKMSEQLRNAQEFDIAVRREQLLDKQREENANRHKKVQQAPVGTSNLTFESLLEVVDAPPPPPQRCPTPAQVTRRTLRTFAERAKTPDTSFDALYKIPTQFSLHGEGSKYTDEYDGIAPPAIRERPSTTQPNVHRRRSLSSQPADSRLDLNSPSALRVEVEDFEQRRSTAEAEEAEYSDEVRALIHAAQIPPPPKLILMLFRFGNVRNLPITLKLRDVGYSVIHEQFYSSAERGCITRQSYLNVIRRYAATTDMNDAQKILNCFDKSSTGDVDLNHFLLGMQILLRCASAADTLKYCFSLMDTNSRVPRYVTRFEVQSLLSSALNVRKERQVDLNRSGQPPPVDDEEDGDREFDVMARAIHELMEESWRYDYMGRIGLKEFLNLLREKVNGWMHCLKTARAEGSPRSGARRPAALLDSMGLGQSGQHQPVVAAAHRMSSKKMLYASLQYLPSNALKDPHRIPAPSTLAHQGSFASGLAVPTARQNRGRTTLLQKK